MEYQRSYGILFDYNGVLVGDEHLQYKAMVLVLKKYQYKLSQEEYDRVCLGRTDKAAFEVYKESLPQLTDVPLSQLLEEKVKTYQEVTENESIVYPGIVKLIEKLSKKYAVGVVTGGLRVEVEPTLRKSGIYDFLSAFIAAEDTARGKPYPDGYKKGAELLGLSANDVMAVEDTPAGVRAAKAAGMFCIAVEATGSKEVLTEADMVLQKTTDISEELVSRVFGNEHI